MCEWPRFAGLSGIADFLPSQVYRLTPIWAAPAWRNAVCVCVEAVQRCSGEAPDRLGDTQPGPDLGYARPPMRFWSADGGTARYRRRWTRRCGGAASCRRSALLEGYRVEPRQARSARAARRPDDPDAASERAGSDPNRPFVGLLEIVGPAVVGFCRRADRSAYTSVLAVGILLQAAHKRTY
jgi:hypothetical protein